MAAPITFRNIGSNVNAGQTGRALSSASAGLTNSLSGLANLLRGVDQQRDASAEESFRNQLAGLSAEQLAGFNVGDIAQNSRLGADQLTGILNKNLTGARNREASEFAFQEAQRQRQDDPILNTLLSRASGATTRADVQDIARDIEGSGLSPQGITTAMNQLRGIGDSRFNQNRKESQIQRQDALLREQEETNRRRTTTSELAKNLALGHGPKITKKSKEDITTNLNNTINNLNKEFDSNLSIKVGEDGQFDLEGDFNTVAFQKGIAFDESKSVEERTELLKQFANNPMEFVKQQVNNTIDSTSIDTEDNTLDLRKQFVESEHFRNLPLSEQTDALGQFTQALSNRALSPTFDQSGFDASVQTQIQNRQVKLQDAERKILEIENTLPDPKKLHTTDKAKTGTMTKVVDFIRKNSDDMGTTYRPGMYGGSALVKKVESIINNGFTTESGVKIKPEQLSEDMIMGALAGHHEYGNVLDDEAVDLEAFKETLAKASNTNLQSTDQISGIREEIVDPLRDLLSPVAIDQLRKTTRQNFLGTNPRNQQITQQLKDAFKLR